MWSVFSAMLIRSGKQTGLRAGLQGCRAGRGWGLPLTSQRSQPHLLNPGCSAPRTLVPGTAEPTPFLGRFHQTSRRRLDSSQCPGKTCHPHATTPRGSWLLSLTAGARGIRRDCGGQVGAWLESQLPILSSWDKILPSLPLKSAHLPT